MTASVARPGPGVGGPQQQWRRGVLGTRIEPDRLAALHQIAEHLGLSASDLVRCGVAAALAAFLDQIDGDLQPAAQDLIHSLRSHKGWARPETEAGDAA